MRTETPVEPRTIAYAPQLRRVGVRRTLYHYFDELVPTEYDSNDLHNLAEQGMDALDAVLQGYEQVKAIDAMLHRNAQVKART